uniref:mRNA (guanine-N(7))-methyltransferase n=1 Tax=viral metagenome TaxID=1070528 RepID=A0A6C0LCJ4_9ZZZZ
MASKQNKYEKPHGELRGELRGKPREKPNPQIEFDKMVKLFVSNNPYIKDMKKNNELEVRFGTRGIKPLTKVDYDSVIRKLKSLGFECRNEQGESMLRIQNEFLDANTGTFQLSPIRAEINGFHGVQEYCKNNDINKMLSTSNMSYSVGFYKKTMYKHGEERIMPVNFDDFNFRVSYQVEEKMSSSGGVVKGILDNWIKSKKTFRYINRVTFQHSSIPVKVDVSIVKSSKLVNRELEKTYTTEESGVFTNQEIYEIELEVDNDKIGPNTEFNTAEELMQSIRKAIKFVLMGLQDTNYPISYPEQKEVLFSYMRLIHGKEPEKPAFPNDFIGPSSYTLQIENIVPINENANIPNIRKSYTVTDKADGDRALLFISEKGKLYLLNTNMKVIFTGVQTKTKEIFNTLIDGELIYHNKSGRFINLFAAFDVYFIDKLDVRSYGFSSDKSTKFRLPLLKNIIRKLRPESVVPGAISPMRFECKQFYPTILTDDIFSACKFIIQKEKDGLFDYEIDGLIFTPALMGVGADEIGKAGPLYKTTWEYSFKWKPPKYNTIDFLVTTEKGPNGTDKVTPIFQSGTNTSSVVQLNEYKTVVLLVGFNNKKHGYLNPCNDVIEDNLPNFKDLDNDKLYQPVQFFPTNPYDSSAGICNIMLKRDDTGISHMFSEDNEAFEDDTIVEFSYDMEKEAGWRWVPLRVRYDKTSDYRQGGKNFGNAYHVANSNWHSIHNPITEEMICTGNNIPDEVGDDDVYYNRVTSAKRTQGLRDFHNLFVKMKLITSVSKPGNILIDYACGKGGDFSKWIQGKLEFVFGIDVSKDNLENRLDGACARFLNYRKKFKRIPYALFVNGNSSANIRSGRAMLNEKAIQITKAVFGEGVNDEEKLGKGVTRQFGKGAEGFNISSCQFAIHYFFENQVSLQNFLRNVAETTKLGGYFIGTSYDGKTIFNILKQKKLGESLEIYEGKTKIWEVQKDYEQTEFLDDISSVGYQISVYQESINKMFPEFLVNYDYLERVMENYGFKLITREEAQSLGLPEATGMFSDLYQQMLEEVKRNRFKANDYGNALDMTAYEKKISFLNRYFVYKKIRHVNAEKLAIELLEDTESLEETRAAVKVAKKEEKLLKKQKPKAKRLQQKFVLEQPGDTVEAKVQEEKVQEEKVEEEKAEVKEKAPAVKKVRAKKPKLVIQEE